MRYTWLLVAILAGLYGCSKNESPSAPNVQADSVEAGQQVDEANDETTRLNVWLEEKYEEYLQRSPMEMTSLGRKDKYDQIDDMSEAAEDEMLAWREQTIAEMKAGFDYSKLTEDAKVSYDLMAYQVERDQAMQPFRRHVYLYNQMYGLHAYLPTFLINFHKVDDESDMRAYISRLGGGARAIGQMLVRTKASVEDGVRAPYFAYDGVIKQSKAIISGQPFDEDSEADAPLWADVKSKVSALVEQGVIDEAKAEQLRQAAQQALLDKIQPAYSELISWFEADRTNASEQAKGAGSLPNGEAYYNAQLARNTTTELNAEQIHELGLQEVARIHGLMDEVRQKVGFEGDMQAFFDFIKTDEQFFYPNTDEGRQGYLDDSTRYLDYIKSKLPEYFGLLPKADLVVKRVEAFRERDGAAQHYFAGTPDGARPGIYYAHLSDMNSMPKNEMEAIAYHEGNPGHHMQISIAQELTGVPTFRTQLGFTAYVEGWALYAEQVAEEMGAYENPYTLFGRYITEIWRAIRLVVDTGIHAKGWSEEQAVQYFLDNSPIAEGQVRSEVQRYFVIPGQATAYKIGMLKILELRGKAQQALGDKFDIRGFHDVVLGGGSVPLSVLERRVDQWIAAQ